MQLPSVPTAAVFLAKSPALLSILSDLGSLIESTKRQRSAEVVMVSSKSGLHLVARQSQRRTDAATPNDANDHESDSARLAIVDRATENEPQLEARSGDEALGDSMKATFLHGVPETIQAKYKLPPMELEAPANELVASTTALEIQQSSESCATPKVSRVEYEQVKEGGGLASSLWIRVVLGSIVCGTSACA